MGWLRKLLGLGPYRYEILVGTSYASADEAARAAQVKLNAQPGIAVGIAADAMCCSSQGSHGDDAEGGARGVVVARQNPGLEFNVYVLVRS